LRPVRRRLRSGPAILALILALVASGPAPAAAAGVTGPEVTCAWSTGPGGPAAELGVDGQVVMRLRQEAGGLDLAQRCSIVRDRLLDVLARDGKRIDPRPGVVSGQAVVAAGATVLVAVLPETARFNDTSPGLLAWRWANNLREALGLEPLPLSAAPYQGLPGVQRVRASWYGWELAGRRTASGERFSPEELTAAHRTLPFGTRVRVIAPWSGEQVVVRINDRGPWAHDRDFDLSLGAARAIGLDRRGVADVLVEVVDGPASR